MIIRIPDNHPFGNKNMISDPDAVKTSYIGIIIRNSATKFQPGSFIHRDENPGMEYPVAMHNHFSMLIDLKGREVRIGHRPAQA